MASQSPTENGRRRSTPEDGKWPDWLTKSNPAEEAFEPEEELKPVKTVRFEEASSEDTNAPSLASARPEPTGFSAQHPPAWLLNCVIPDKPGILKNGKSDGIFSLPENKKVRPKAAHPKRRRAPSPDYITDSTVKDMGHFDLLGKYDPYLKDLCKKKLIPMAPTRPQNPSPSQIELDAFERSKKRARPMAAHPSRRRPIYTNWMANEIDEIPETFHFVPRPTAKSPPPSLAELGVYEDSSCADYVEAKVAEFLQRRSPNMFSNVKGNEEKGAKMVEEISDPFPRQAERSTSSDNMGPFTTDVIPKFTASAITFGSSVTPEIADAVAPVTDHIPHAAPSVEKKEAVQAVENHGRAPDAATIASLIVPTTKVEQSKSKRVHSTMNNRPRIDVAPTVAASANKLIVQPLNVPVDEPDFETPTQKLCNFLKHLQDDDFQPYKEIPLLVESVDHDAPLPDDLPKKCVESKDVVITKPEEEIPLPKDSTSESVVQAKEVAVESIKKKKKNKKKKKKKKKKPTVQSTDVSVEESSNVVVLPQKQGNLLVFLDKRNTLPPLKKVPLLDTPLPDNLVKKKLVKSKEVVIRQPEKDIPIQNDMMSKKVDQSKEVAVEPIKIRKAKVRPRPSKEVAVEPIKIRKAKVRLRPSEVMKKSAECAVNKSPLPETEVFSDNKVQLDVLSDISFEIHTPDLEDKPKKDGFLKRLRRRVGGFIQKHIACTCATRDEVQPVLLDI